MIFFFSGTGNSQYVAQQVSASLHETLICITDESYSGSAPLEILLQPEENVGFIFPVYAWGPPIVMLDFIRRLSFKHISPDTYIYMIGTCGDDAGCTEQILRKVLQQKGWHLDAAFSVTFPNTYVSLPGFNIDNPDREQKKLLHAQTRLKEITESLQKGIRPLSQVHEGSFPILKSYVIRPLFNRLLMSDRPFHTNGQCNGCELCSRECPAHNIQMQTNRRPHWLGHCTGCLRCYHSCPRRAIEYGRYTQGKGQYLLKKSLKRCLTTRSQR